MSRVITITAIIAFFAAIPAQAADIYAEYVRNYDGDTVTVDLVDLRYRPQWYLRTALGQYWNPRRRCRYPRDPRQMRGGKILAKEAKALVKSVLKDAEFITIRNAKRGKYFRIVGDIIIEPGTDAEVNLKDILLDANLAVPYNGGRKTKSWCN